MGVTLLELNSDADEKFDEYVTYFADVIVPIPLSGTYTYRIPRELNEVVSIGSRVIVQFGRKKVYTGVVRKIHTSPPKVYEAKLILDCLDSIPAINEFQLKFFSWLAQYYMCTLGEVLNAGLPSGLKLTSQSFIQINPAQIDSDYEYSDKEFKVLEALKANEKLTYDQVSELLGVKMIHGVLKSLIQKESIILYEQVKDKYKPKIEKRFELEEENKTDSVLELLFEQLEKRPKQLAILLKYLSLCKIDEGNRVMEGVSKESLLEGNSSSALKTLVKNKVFKETEHVVSRLSEYSKYDQIEQSPLSIAQQTAYDEIIKNFDENKPVLLHGVTGSGKTEIYVKLIQDALENGGQVLYLLPEIALTTQIVTRLFKVFGEQLGVYHSKYSDNERVEVWDQVNQGSINLVAGVRSSVFLPFNNLSLIIIDEEHEVSYKQYDPSPRYHARDAAIWLSHLHGSKVLMGTATPSLETYQNCIDDKYKLVELTERYGTATLPKFELANILTSRKNKRMKGDFTPELVASITEALDKKEQVILFQNRRGYSPYLICNDCNHVPKCNSCDVSLTFHMHSNTLICHYCGYKESVPALCEACGSTAIKTVGVGTEKIEEDLKILFPAAHIQRMDQDTTRSKYAYQNIIDRFQNQETDILVGTQMLSKGLDFDNVSLVGVFDYDRIVHFPDFRSHERAFQLITQVSGRAGRKDKEGKVVIQTGDSDSALMDKIIRGDYLGFYQNEILERSNFRYPPFYRLIRIIIKHKDLSALQNGARTYADTLKAELGVKRILGPQPPSISRIRNMYLEEIFVKIEKKGVNITKLKDLLYQKAIDLSKNKTYKDLRVYFDVDPV